ncbi:MAG: hypothetical protein LIQ30_04065, partial [Planctomycetes bacterium]|nr:hypothetical protein [Planctomycetota bacterium]
SAFQAFPGMEPPVEMTLIQPENADDNQATETEVEPVSAAEALATAGNGRAAAEPRTDEASDDPTEESPPESSDTSSDASADEATDESSDALVDDLSVESTAEPSADPSDSQSGQPSGTPRVDPTENVPAESLPAGDGFDSDGDFDILASLPNGDGDDAATDDTGSAGESEPVPE